MAKNLAKKLYYTSTDIAEVCDVDVKTVHIWAGKGRIEVFRTPGRHLRITHDKLMTFLREHGFPIPAAFGGQEDKSPSSGAGCVDAVCPVIEPENRAPVLKVGGTCQGRGTGRRGTVDQLYPNTALVNWDSGQSSEEPRHLLIPIEEG